MLVVGFSMCSAKGMLALVLRCMLVLRCNSTGVLTANNLDPGC